MWAGWSCGQGGGGHLIRDEKVVVVWEEMWCRKGGGVSRVGLWAVYWSRKVLSGVESNVV